MKRELAQRLKLIDDFQRLLDTHPDPNILAASCATIAEDYAPPDGGWVSVKDALPKDEKMVIAFDGKNVFAAEYDPNNSCGEYGPSKWYDCEAECFIIQDHDHPVTHWMPLPHPPKF